MKKKTNTEKLFTFNYILLILTAFIGGFIMSFFVPVLPLYAERLTGSTVYAGLVTSVYTFATIIARPVAGVACERGRHVKLMFLGFLIMTASCISYWLASSIAIFLAIRVLHGIGFGIKTTASGVIAAENIPKSRFAEGIGIYNLYIPLTTAVGPAVATSIVGDGHDMGKFNQLFIIAAVMGAIAAVLCFFIKDKAEEEAKAAKRRKAGDEAGVDKLQDVANATEVAGSEEDPAAGGKSALPKTFLGFEFGVVWPSIVLAFMYVGQGAVMSFITLFAIDSGLGGVGRFFTVNAAAIFISRLLFAKAVKHIRYDRPVIFGMILFGIALFAIPFTKSVLSLCAVSAMLGIAQGMVPMVLNAITLERCSKQRTGTAMAAYSSSMDLGVGIGSMVLGAILELSGYGCIFTISAVSSVFGAVIYLITLKGDKKVINL